MPDENKSESLPVDIDAGVENANLPKWQNGLSQAVNETYTYSNSNLFYALIPTYYRDYAWRYIRVACNWMDGYVPSIHGDTTGIISTRIGGSLITGLTKQIVGEKLVFKVNKQDVNNDEILSEVSTWSEEQDIFKAVFAGVGFSLGIGTSCIKINKTNSGKYWWEAVRFDNCYYEADFKNEVKDAKFVIRNYTDTRADKNTTQFFLVEHRYYIYWDKPQIIKKMDGTYEVLHKKGDRTAMVEYEVHRVTGTVFNKTSTPDRQKLNWSEIPNDIRKMIKENYSAWKINDPMELGLDNLGVEPLLNGEIDLSVPTGMNFGESMLVKIQSELLTYELACSYLIRDMYLGKGTVYVPKSMNLNMFTPGFNSKGGVLDGIGEDKYEQVKGVDPDKQQIIVQQFDVRPEAWEKIKEDSLKNIAVKWGMSPKILANFLTNGQAQMTATQIDSEDDSCIAFIYNTRSYFKAALNRLLKTTLHAMGLVDTITMDFASPSLLNKDRLLNRVTNELNVGLIDMEEAIRILNPDLEEGALKEKIEKAKQREAEMMMANMSLMNEDGTFGSEEKLNGTTNPIS